MEILKEAAVDKNGAESEMAGMKAEIVSLTDKIQSPIDRNARLAQDQAEYEACYQELMERYEEKKVLRTGRTD